MAIVLAKSVSFLKTGPMSDKDYFRKILADAALLKISVKWDFDEAQADPFHHKFNSIEFFSRLRNIVKREG